MFDHNAEYEEFCQKPYEELYQASLKTPEEFWAKVGKSVKWSKRWDKVVDNSNEPFTQWYVGGETNACYNAVDRHVEDGKGEKEAIIYVSPVTDTVQRITYRELLGKVAKLAASLIKMGVEKGDTVVIYMPIIPETIVAMLATCRIGAIHSVIFGGFGQGELSRRINHIKPKVIIAASCGVEPNKIIDYKNILEHTLKSCETKPTKCIIFQRRNVLEAQIDGNFYVDWDEVIKNVKPHPCVPVEANHPLYILYTSGTTGSPKGVQRPTGGHIATLAWTMKALYNMDEEDVWWAASDFGWVVGHSYMCYAPLLYGITTVIYEGKPVQTPDAVQYFRVIDSCKVSALFSIPTALRIIKRALPEGKSPPFHLKSLKHVFLAGEHCDVDTLIWAKATFGVPCVNHWWQTETGHAITTNCVGLKHSASQPKLSSGKAVPGFDVQVLRVDGGKALCNELGRIVLKLPLPPGTLSTLYNSSKTFLDTYFGNYKGFYDTMDAGYIDKDGYVFVTARDDEVIKVAGHRLSTSSIENVVLSHPDVIDAAVVGVVDAIKGEVPLCLFVARNGSNEAAVQEELVLMVRENVGPVADFKLVVKVDALPKTRSGKTCRKLISSLANNKHVSDNIFDVLVMDVFEDTRRALRKVGLGDKLPALK